MAILKRKRPAANTASLERARDYETHLDNGIVRIHEGHPAYCSEQQMHRPHLYLYEYLNGEGEVVSGNMICDGQPFTFAPTTVGSGSSSDPADATPQRQ